jgi:hypothetical protein
MGITRHHVDTRKISTCNFMANHQPPCYLLHDGGMMRASSQHSARPEKAASLGADWRCALQVLLFSPKCATLQTLPQLVRKLAHTPQHGHPAEQATKSSSCVGCGM